MEDTQNEEQTTLIYPMLYPMPSAPLQEESIYFAQTNLGVSSVYFIRYSQRNGKIHFRNTLQNHYRNH